jgi:DNA-binding HxlR family transcriptional regulator
MTRTSLDHHNCSFARTVDLIGDRWSLMILRDAFYGVRRFSQFKRDLGVTQAVLSARLAQMVDHGLLAREPVGAEKAREEYRLTSKGRDLFPVIVSLMQWGDRWIHHETGAPVILADSQSGRPVDRIEVTVGGEPRKPTNLLFSAGPGATSETTNALMRVNVRNGGNLGQ